MVKIINRPCDDCGTPYETQSKRSRFCSGACKTRAGRAGGGRVVPIREAAESDERESNVSAVRADLEALGVGSALASQALTLAARLDRSHDESGASVAAVSRELRAVMDAARVTGRPASAIDELRSRRDAKWAGITA